MGKVYACLAMVETDAQKQIQCVGFFYSFFLFLRWVSLYNSGWSRTRDSSVFTCSADKFVGLKGSMKR